MYLLPDFVVLFPGYRDKVLKLLVLFCQYQYCFVTVGRGPVWFQQEKSCVWKQKVRYFCLALFRKKIPWQPDGAVPLPPPAVPFPTLLSCSFCDLVLKGSGGEPKIPLGGEEKRVSAAAWGQSCGGQAPADLRGTNAAGICWSWTREMEWPERPTPMIQLPRGFVCLGFNFCFLTGSGWGDINLWKLSFAFMLLLFSHLPLAPVQSQSPSCLCLGNRDRCCLQEAFLFGWWW